VELTRNLQKPFACNRATTISRARARGCECELHGGYFEIHDVYVFPNASRKARAVAKRIRKQKYAFTCAHRNMLSEAAERARLARFASSKRDAAVFREMLERYVDEPISPAMRIFPLAKVSRVRAYVRLITIADVGRIINQRRRKPEFAQGRIWRVRLLNY